jgi:hypothetical protein
LVFELVAREKIDSKEGQLNILQIIGERPYNNYIKQQTDFIFIAYPKQGKLRSNLVHCVINFG